MNKCTVCRGRGCVAGADDWEDCWKCEGSGQHVECAPDCEGCPACVGLMAAPAPACGCDGSHCNGR